LVTLLIVKASHLSFDHGFVGWGSARLHQQHGGAAGVATDGSRGTSQSHADAGSIVGRRACSSDRRPPHRHEKWHGPNRHRLRSRGAHSSRLGASSAAPSIPAVPETPPPSRRQRAWVPDTALLLLLAIAGLVVWYSKLPTDFRFLDLREWVKVHILH
jgi:hypothetical protein